MVFKTFNLIKKCFFLFLVFFYLGSLSQNSIFKFKLDSLKKYEHIYLNIDHNFSSPLFFDITTIEFKLGYSGETMNISKKADLLEAAIGSDSAALAEFSKAVTKRKKVISESGLIRSLRIFNGNLVSKKIKGLQFSNETFKTITGDALKKWKCCKKTIPTISTPLFTWA